jgi:hypothetical protein
VSDFPEWGGNLTASVPEEPVFGSGGRLYADEQIPTGWADVTARGEDDIEVISAEPEIGRGGGQREDGKTELNPEQVAAERAAKAAKRLDVGTTAGEFIGIGLFSAGWWYFSPGLGLICLGVCVILLCVLITVKASRGSGPHQ